MNWFCDISNNAIRPIWSFILDYLILVMWLCSDLRRTAIKEYKFLSRSHKEK